MSKEEIYSMLEVDLAQQIHLLSDKPEETVESTLKALWFKALGVSKSAETALEAPLPELTHHQEATLQELIKQRLSGVPLAFLTERQTFMNVEFKADHRALIPRKETEILGYKVLALCRDLANHNEAIDIMDMCCGSGNLGLAVAHSLPQVTVYSSDLSEEAVELAKENAAYLNLTSRVHVACGNLFSVYETHEFHNRFDLIMCNPPYISSAKVGKMDAEIALNEPSLAFDGGMLGMNVIQTLIDKSPVFLKSGGWLAFEVGLGQGPFVIQLCQKTGSYQSVSSESDQHGNIRVIYAKSK
jgi:release factor glutamine methyltransferase